MPSLRHFRPRHGLPLVLQILILLLGGLVVAQLVTLLLTILLPPVRPPQHSLRAVAAALRGATVDPNRPDRLLHRMQPAAPDVDRPGWLVVERYRRDLAILLKVDVADVRLAFYTPLPFAGTTGPAMRPPMPYRIPIEAGYAMLLQGEGARFPGGFRSGPVGGYRPAGAGDRPIGRAGGVRPEPGLPSPFPAGRGGGPFLPGESAIRDRTGASGAAPRPVFGENPARGGPTIGALPAAGRDRTGSGMAGNGMRPVPILPLRDRDMGWSLPGRTMTATPPAPAATLAAPDDPIPARSDPPPSRIATPVVRPAPAVPVAPVIRVAAPPVRTAIPSAAPVVDRTMPLAPVPRGVFALAPAGFVEGDFVAALRQPDGLWSVVQPTPEPFPNYWQRRVLLWFLIAFAVVAPIGWLFARRIVKPLIRFGAAAEQLGRDPTALIVDLDGPAEVGRAAHAFNQMQSRLKSFVDDRTAMVGAISHDLRTPLTRMRFRIEDIEDDQVRDGMIDEVTEMEAMITSVLAFIRDASTPCARERLDLGTILEDVVEDARLVGGRVTMETTTPARVDVDPLGMRRLLANLIDNATKYGDRARVRLMVAQEEAVAEIIDDGPGLPEHELERAFEPFYRSADARASVKQGSGLGLAVCRSIARAHGGDVRLMRSDAGFVAQLRVPLAFDADRIAA